MTDPQNTDSDSAIKGFVRHHVPAKKLMKKYGADNIAYLAIMNMSKNSKTVPYTVEAQSEDDLSYISMFYYSQKSLTPPAVYAHEILHTFGAEDLYTIDGKDNKKNLPYKNDIMFTCSDLKTGDYIYDTVSNKVTKITARALGWAK